MTLTPSSTLYSDFSFPQSEQFAATELLHSLLQEVEAVVSSSRYGLRASYKLIDRVRDRYNEINRRISRVVKTHEWDDYDAYTKAIDPLEQILLEVIPAIYENQIDLIAPISSEDLVKSAEKWLINERTICECFRRLGTEAELQELVPSSQDIEDEIVDATTQDRQDFFNGLLLDILDKAPQCTQPNLQVLLKYVIGCLQSAWNTFTKDPVKFANEEWSIVSIKCAILTRGILIYVTQAPSMPNLPDDFRWGGMIWKQILGMMSLVNETLSSESMTSATLEPPKHYQPAMEVNNGAMVSYPPHSHLLPIEFIRKSKEHSFAGGTQPHDPPWALFNRLQEHFPNPHTPTHSERLSLYRTYSLSIAQSPPPLFSAPTTAIAARTPALRWLPGLRVALAFRSSASLPRAYSVCGRLPLYRFLGIGFGVNS
ncbi:hypothetical protein OPQ81_006211 [Rhizoctonia solani]|nr:hypothetical protein OPQ81_006211 [Rhizoctonia solani]